MSTVYDPTLHATPAAARGEQMRLFYSVNKLLVDLDAAGIIDLIKAVDAPGDTSQIWLDTSDPENTNGVPRGWDGSEWQVLDKSMFYRHISSAYGSFVTTAELDAAVAAAFAGMDADLTSWALITRASGFDTFVATPSSANLQTLLTDETGTGAAVFAISPTLVTPNIGTPSAAVLTNATGLPTAGLNDDAVTNAKLANMAANTVKVRAANSSGDPSDLALSASQLIGRGSTGDVAAISMASHVEFSGATFNGNKAPTQQVFASSGTWTKPSGCRFIKVTVIGAGGGGGGVNASLTNYAFGAGGGAGGIAIEWINATALTSETVTIGAGGAGGAAGTNPGSSGGTSSFGAHCSASGGAGGESLAAATGHSVRLSGVSGVGSGGNINISGIPGPPNYRVSGSTVIAGGSGGSTLFGAGGVGSVVFSTSAVGAAGSGFGGGGAGAASANDTTNRAGGDGASGGVIVEEFY
jgi:hypothetical protein